jgi:hypothetical protein
VGHAATGGGVVMSNMQLKSELYSLATLTSERPHWRFNVPIYQRLYVWGGDQVQTLLNDLINAFERGESLFYLGGVLMVEHSDPKADGAASARVFDLIDGQQRFTTLWMLCHAWRRALEPFLTVPVGREQEPRLRFAIRPEVNRMLDAWANQDPAFVESDETGLERMGQAVERMKQVFSARAQTASGMAPMIDWDGLTRFVYDKVKFVVTEVPRETDLNKLFEVINNRGVQLQHHEILKARMLDALDEHERAGFAVLWDACADMDNYCERNLAVLSGLPAYEVHALYGSGRLGDANAVRDAMVSRLRAAGDHQALDLAAILDAETDDGDDASGDEGAVVPGRVRSIVGFPLLLQHVLRIWLCRHGRPDLPRILDRELLTLFDVHFFDAATGVQVVREFIDLLWQVRVLFDLHLIKWVDRGDEDIHLISSVTTSTTTTRNTSRSYINRSRDTDSHRGFALLQSMLYHSQEITTHYWLTPLLSFMVRYPDEKARTYFRFLQHLDNQLLCSAADASLAVRTRSFMEVPWQERRLVYQDVLTRPNGVNFAHYWFYKLEFVLWHQQKRLSEEWQRFRLTAKNSVEHISPQTPSKRDDNRADQMMDRFGNLALVSRSINSEYGNLPFNEKRQRFLNNNKSKLDSLKMALIYENGTWSDDLAQAHEEDMLECFDRYITSCGRGS